MKRDALSARKVRKDLSARKVDAALGPIEPGCEIFGLTMGHFSLVDIVEHVLKSTGPADVTISHLRHGNGRRGAAFKARASAGVRLCEPVRAEGSALHRR